MDRPSHRTSCRAFAVLLSALVGLLGAAAVTAPAHAAPTTVTGGCDWDPEAGAWVVTWRVAPEPPEGATGFTLDAVTPTPAGDLSGMAPGSVPHPAGEPLTGEQVLPGTRDEPPAPRLALSAGWDDPAATTEEWTGEASCDVPERPELISEFTFDCDALTITVVNPGSETARLRFAPVRGDPFGVDVAGGESANVRVPAEPGQSVDVTRDGRSIVDPDTPIQITKADWAQVDCGGEATDETTGLAATGSRVALVAVAALALVGLGGGLYLLARRRRIRFTA